ncbi:hypothetical protein VNO77_10426 [Canavalia gladiata]|uniref:Uncharacterized protein n=1 Tax=Canavalia gladiata TaxID=3824 RepID=A0AAN9MFV4_CANGL
MPTCHSHVLLLQSYAVNRVDAQPRSTRNLTMAKPRVARGTHKYYFCPHFLESFHFVWLNFLLIFISFFPPSVTSRFSESLSVNHLSFKLRFLGLSFNSPRSKLRRISRKPGVFRNEIQVFYIILVICR